MLPFFTERFGNPHSTAHAFGWDAEEAVEQARGQLAALIGASPREVIFTSGATEYNNLAINGAARFTRDTRRQAETTAREHKRVDRYRGAWRKSVAGRVDTHGRWNIKNNTK